MHGQHMAEYAPASLATVTETSMRARRCEYEHRTAWLQQGRRRARMKCAGVSVKASSSAGIGAVCMRYGYQCMRQGYQCMRRAIVGSQTRRYRQTFFSRCEAATV
eukprot:6174348-Pleurochrysis_carterae.AAC.2